MVLESFFTFESGWFTNPSYPPIDNREHFVFQDGRYSKKRKEHGNVSEEIMKRNKLDGYVVSSSNKRIIDPGKNRWRQQSNVKY